MYQLSSFRLIACELIMACLFIVSAQGMMLVYGTWTTDMPRNKTFCKATGGLYIHMSWNIHHRILVYMPQTYHHITIWPYTRTATHSRTHTHIYMYTNMHNMNTAYIHHHNITYQNIIWRIITSRYMQQDQYIYVCIHLHYYHPTSHHTKIISPHAHIHIRITSACTSHILQTACYTRYTYRLHTTKVTHLYMHIHTYTQTHRPSPLHHSHTSSSLVAFLCSV